ncbi:hypothetical protein GCM10010218_06980 [Streptomyces mashuensis]|uniref:Secreted protein n=1 Tax=Streptomyces mashuensis TaxID=33904 RepID=A0A919AXP4_9ACTN|nr:hypothetical protein GCM10010218_06980 [Streptomyces mashuensis]
MVPALAWVLATGAATAVSWYGVRTVLTGTAYEPPRALPIGRAAPSSPAAVATVATAGAPGTAGSPAPSASPSLTPSPAPPSPSASPVPAAPPEGSFTAAASGGVRSYVVKGGRAVFDVGGASATLVSATPDEGRQMRVWTQAAWIRVDFVAGARTSSVFVTWNGHPPQVQTVEN